MEEYPPPQRPVPLDAIPDELRERVRNLGLWTRVKIIEGKGTIDEDSFRRGLEGEGEMVYMTLLLLAFTETMLRWVQPVARQIAFYRGHTLSVHKYIVATALESPYLPEERIQQIWRESFARAWRFTVIFTPTAVRANAVHELEVAWVQAYERSRANRERNYNALDERTRNVLKSL